MKTSRIRIFAASTALLVVLAVAGARWRKACIITADPWVEFGFGDHMLGYFSDVLDLTQAQQDQAKAILEKEKPVIQPLMKQLMQAHKDLSSLEDSGTFDEAKVRALAAQNTQAMTELFCAEGAHPLGTHADSHRRPESEARSRSRPSTKRACRNTCRSTRRIRPRTDTRLCTRLGLNAANVQSLSPNPGGARSRKLRARPVFSACESNARDCSEAEYMKQTDLISSGMMFFAEGMLWLWTAASARRSLLGAAFAPAKNRTPRCYNLIYKTS